MVIWVIKNNFCTVLLCFLTTSSYYLLLLYKVHIISFLYCAHLCMKCSLSISNFFEDISSLSSFLSFLRCCACFSPVAIPGCMQSLAGPNTVPTTEKIRTVTDLQALSSGRFLLVCFCLFVFELSRPPRLPDGKEFTYQCRRHRRCGFDPWVRKIPWRRNWQPIPVFFPGKPHGPRSLEGYSPWGCKELAGTE